MLEMLFFSVIKKYAIPVYDPHYLQNTISLSDTRFIIDEQQFFEQILLEIRGMSIPCASKKKKKYLRKKISLNK